MPNDQDIEHTRAQETQQSLSTLLHDPSVGATLFDEAVAIDFAAPLDCVRGLAEVEQAFYAPLRQALAGLYRRDLLFFGGRNTRLEGQITPAPQDWLVSVTHYVGNFYAPLWGIPASGHVVFLRAGEFYRLEGQRIVEAKILFDLPDLLRQIGSPVFPHDLGTEILFPAPQTQDGLFPSGGDAQNTMRIMEGMFADLHQFDPQDFSSANQTGKTGYWNKQMMWYGPAGIGSNFQWSGFVQDHRQSFLTAFPDRRGGNHYCRVAQGYYSAASGWPSMTMTFRGDYLGVKANNQCLSLRVMDFYRCDDQQICENWVLLDYGDLMRQLGIDIFAQIDKNSE